MVRTASTQVRAALIQQAAEMLARREPVTLRSVVAGTGASTMSVYTHFGDMAGLWRAVRQEGFALLGTRLSAVATTADPVADLATLGAGYLAHALAHPELYRLMFDDAADLEDPEAADAILARLVDAVARGRADGVISASCDPARVGLRIWAGGHGLAHLAVTGVLGTDLVRVEAEEMMTAILVASGGDGAAIASSVRAGWARAG